MHLMRLVVREMKQQLKGDEMNTFKNGTTVIGAPNSYQWFLAAFKDALKDRCMRDYEAVMFRDKIKEAGIKANVSMERMAKDWEDCHG